MVCLDLKEKPMSLFRLLAVLFVWMLCFGCPESPPTDDDDSSSGDDDDSAAGDDDDSAADDDDDSASGDDDDSASGDDDDSASDDDDSAEGLRETELVALSVDLTDANGDGVWSAGEALDITAEVTNQGPEDIGNYPAFLLESDSPYVELGESALFVFFGMSVGEVVIAHWQVVADANAPVSHSVDFSITGTLMDTEQPCGGEGDFEPPCVTSTPLLFSEMIE
jgi:hypothetical protein